MKRMIRCICWLLVLCMTLFMLPAGQIHAAADKAVGTNSVTYGPLTYTIDGTRAYVIDCDESVTSVSIPFMVYGATVVGIEAYAFHNCINLKHVTLPEKLSYIGERAFNECASLTSIDIPASVQMMGFPFSYCTSLTEINVAEDNMSYYSVDGVLYEKSGGLHSYPCGRSGAFTIPDGVNAIGSFCFSGAAGLTDIVIPDSVLYMGEHVFSRCSSLTRVDLPDGITSIPEGTFYLCTALTDVEVPEKITSIGTDAFSACLALSNITIPESVTQIHNHTFSSCTALTEIKLPERLVNIGYGAFRGCTSLTEIQLPAGIISIGAGAFAGNTALRSISIPEENPYYCTVEGVLFDDERTTLMACPGGKTGGYEVPDTVQTISDYAFSGCAALTVVILPTGLLSLGESAFAFCTSLKSIQLPDNPQLFVTINETDASSIFKECTSLTWISLPEGLIQITSWMFHDCSALSSIYIPASIERIDFAAFGNCFELTDVYYGGTQEQWEQITIEIGNSCLESATIHYDKDASDYTGPTTTYVSYLRQWDGEKRIAYLGINDHFGCQVTDQTILPENIGELVGQYVLVTTRMSQVSVFPPDELLSLYPVESHAGTITGGDSTAGTVTIDGRVYNCGGMMFTPWDYVGSYVLYHLYDETLIDFELLLPKKGVITSWFAEDGSFLFRDGINSTVEYTVSPLSEDLTVTLGPTRFLNTNAEFVADSARRIYSITWEEPAPPEPNPRELWIGGHVSFAEGDILDAAVKQGFSHALQNTFLEVRDNGMIYAYRTLDTVNKLLQFDYDVSEQGEYELLLAQILFNENGVDSIIQTYNAYFEEAVVEISGIYLEILQEDYEIDPVMMGLFESALHTAVSSAKGTQESLSAINDLLAVLDKMGEATKQNALLKKLTSPEVTFAANLSANVIDTYLNTYLNAVMYLAAAKSYCDTADTFGEMLLRLRKHINVPSEDPRFMPYYDRPEMMVDDYMIWAQLGIEDANVANCPIYLEQLAAAIEDFYLNLEYMKDGDALGVANKFIGDSGDAVCYDIAQAGMETIFSMMGEFPLFSEVIPLADAIRLFVKGTQFAIDTFTGIDDQAYHGVMVLRLNAMAYIHYLTVMDLAQSIPSEEYGATEEDMLRWANLFDGSVSFYRSILRTAANYGIAYNEVYCDHLDEAAAEPVKFDYEEVMTEEFIRILDLRNLRDNWLSLEWCHALEGDPLEDLEIPRQGVVYTLMCPITVTVRDASGAVIAQLRDEGSSIQPGYEQYFHVSQSRGEGDSCMKIAAVPRDYTVSITGTGTGTMDAVITTYDNGGAGETRYYIDVPIEPGSEGVFTDSASLTFEDVTYTGRTELHVHSYGAPEFSWSADGTGCDVTFFCTGCDYSAVRAAQVACESTATCTKPGVTAFTASVVFDLTSYTDSIRRNVPAKDHTYQTMVTAPTCYDRGFTTYTCLSCGQSHIGDETESMGHTLVDNICTACGAEATEHVQLPGFTWAWTHFADGTLEISGTGSMYDYNQEYEPSYASPSVKHVIIRPGITRIGINCFSSSMVNQVGYELWSRNIRSVELADSVTEIGDSAFNSCTGLQTLVIGSGLQTLGYIPFAYCSALSEIRVSEDNPCFTAIDNALYSKDGTTLYLFPSDAPESYALPMGTELIKLGAFVNNKTTGTLILPSSVNEIDDYAFADCTALDELIFTGDAPNFHWDAFRGADLTVYYPENAEGWESAIQFRFGGTITWIAYDPADPPYETENPFDDVSRGSWYYEPVLWAVENGITNGTSATTFAPNDRCMRAHVVTFLWRAVGCPEPARTDNPFVDVHETDFYYKAVMWALENGITSGMDATHFGPFAYCNRAQVVTFLYRTMNSPGIDSADNPFTDVASGAFYEKPVLWAVENGITNGLSATSFGPNAICNRAQIVTFLYRAFV